MLTPKKQNTPAPKPAAPLPATADSLAGAAYRLLVTTGAVHVRRVSELAAEVGRFAALGADSHLPQAIETLQAGVDAMQPGAADPKAGWLARASGRDRDALGPLAAQCLRFESERDQVDAEAREVLGRWDAQAAAARRMLVEYVVEVQALDRTLVSAAKLLRDMKRTLRKERALAESGITYLELEALGERADAIHARLRHYEALPRTAHQVHRLAQEITSTRTVLAKVLRNDLALHTGRFHERLQRLLALSPGPARPKTGDALELADEGRKDLQMWLAQTSATCMRLQHQEHQAAHTIAKLRERAAAVLQA